MAFVYPTEASVVTAGLSLSHLRVLDWNFKVYFAFNLLTLSIWLIFMLAFFRILSLLEWILAVAFHADDREPNGEVVRTLDVSKADQHEHHAVQLVVSADVGRALWSNRFVLAEVDPVAAY